MTGAPDGVSVLVLTPQFPPAYLGGGPARTMEGMVRQCADPERIAVVTSDTDHGQSERMDVPSEAWTRHEGAQVWYGDVRSTGGLVRALRAGRRLRPDFVYLNSMFHSRLAILPLLLHKLGFWRGAQVVLAPRGEADAGALAIKARKKRAFLRAARVVRLHQDVWWHASSPLEAANIRALGIVPDRILIKENETLLPESAVRQARPSAGPAPLVYVGRVSPKKRLEVLLRALSAVEGSFVLRVVGSCDDPAYEEGLRAMAAPLGDKVQWLGPAGREDVFGLLDQSVAACFPTAGENFGHVIAESLSRSCPVFVEDVTPWTAVVEGGGGVLVGQDPDQPSETLWAAALQTFVNQPGSWPAMSEGAAAAFEGWRASVDSRSFFDYFLDGTYPSLLEAP